MLQLSKEAYMSVSWGKRTTKLDKSTILYAIANRKYVEVHVNKDYVFKTSASFMVVKEQLAEGFIEVKRGLVVSERAIDYIADTIRLVNGEELDYTIRRKREIVEKLRKNKKLQIVMTKRGIYEENFSFQWDEYFNLRRDWRNDIINTSIREQREYMELDGGKYVCAMFVRKYPNGLSDQFLSEITNLLFPLIYTMDVEPVDNAYAYQMMMKKYMSNEPAFLGGNIDKKKR